jgi:hypothetical protein
MGVYVPFLAPGASKAAKMGLHIPLPGSWGQIGGSGQRCARAITGQAVLPSFSVDETKLSPVPFLTARKSTEPPPTKDNTYGKIHENRLKRHP